MVGDKNITYKTCHKSSSRFGDRGTIQLRSKECEAPVGHSDADEQ